MVLLGSCSVCCRATIINSISDFGAVVKIQGCLRCRAAGHDVLTTEGFLLHRPGYTGTRIPSGIQLLGTYQVPLWRIYTYFKSHSLFEKGFVSPSRSLRIASVLEDNMAPVHTPTYSCSRGNRVVPFLPLTYVPGICCGWYP